MYAIRSYYDFYYYFQNGGNGKGGVGVATSLNPEGPYTESTGKRLVAMHDPAIFNDDDGQSYLYSQNKAYRITSYNVCYTKLLRAFQ